MIAVIQIDSKCLIRLRLCVLLFLINGTVAETWVGKTDWAIIGISMTRNTTYKTASKYGTDTGTKYISRKKNIVFRISYSCFYKLRNKRKEKNEEHTNHSIYRSYHT